jgi:HSP20 family molecular chaperone IbpA
VPAGSYLVSSHRHSIGFNGIWRKRNRITTCRERSFGSFERSFQVPEDVDVSKIGASFNKGVLTLTLPKSAEAQKAEKKIEIKAG